MTVPGAAGRHAALIDADVGNEPAREVTLASDAVRLGAFATALVHWANASAAA